jgi:acetolactate synthase-1/3 small subunit
MAGLDPAIGINVMEASDGWVRPGHDDEQDGSNSMSGQQDNATRTATISVLVDNEAGILARVIGLFTGRGYNIDSLTVAAVDAGGALSRINLVTSGTAMVITQIKAQLNRLVQVHLVSDLTEEGPHVAREMALVKVVGTGEKRVEALRIAETFRARVVDTTTGSFVFEITGASEKLDAFIDLMRDLGLAEVSRTGIAALARGARTISTLQSNN